MYGDTDVMRRRAGQLREQGADIRRLADRLVAQVESIGWTGRAADTLQLRIRGRATHLRDVAARHETAAESLERHLQTVADLKDSISEIERRAGALVTDARTRVAAVHAQSAADAERAATTGVQVTRRADPDDERLATFTPPPTGHRDWLGVDLPGLAGS